jgi:hypothetical protein
VAVAECITQIAYFSETSLVTFGDAWALERVDRAG